MRKKGWIVKIIIIMLAGCLLLGCTKGSQKNENLDTSQNVKLVIGGPWEDLRALEVIGQEFSEKYPNCTIEYEYVQDYYESLKKRMDGNTDALDLFFTNNIQENSPMLPYALDLYASDTKLDLSDTYEGLITNFTYMNADETAKPQIYAIPIGGELRGMYVNKTLLDSMQLKVPQNQQELLDACQVLFEQGYVPMNGNPGLFAQQILYPYVSNLIVNSSDYQATYDRINQCDESISELFREPMQFMYTLMEKKYYNYKYVETELGMFTDTSNEGLARDFFHIVSDENGGYVKRDDTGTVAFMSGTMSMESVMAKTREDYHSQIEYEFILAPVSEEGGYAYLSPAHGLAINKNSQQIDGAMEFMNFFFEKSTNKKFAEEYGIISNTNDAQKYIEKKYDIKANHFSQLGQVTFDYGFYDIIATSLMEVSKGNNLKYMKDEGTLYDFEYYMERLKLRFEEQRAGSELLGDD